MKLRVLTLTLLTTLLTLRLTAGTVDPNQIVTFQAGTPATAADMNQTIQALVTAINDNAPKDLNGSSWKIIRQTIALGAEKRYAGSSGPFANPVGDVIGHTVVAVGHVLNYEELIVTLNGNGSFTGTATGCEREVQLEDTAPHYDYEPSYPVASNGIQAEQEDTAANEPLSGTWAVSGNTLTLTIEGEDIPLTLSASRDMLLSIKGSKEVYDTFNGFGGDRPELQTSTTTIGIRTNP